MVIFGVYERLTFCTIEIKAILWRIHFDCIVGGDRDPCGFGGAVVVCIEQSENFGSGGFFA